MHTIIICGTPGVGKSTLIEKIKIKLPEANYINVSKFAIDNDCTDGYDDSLESHVIDDDKLTDKLKPILTSSPLNIVESIHSNHIDPELVDMVFVIRADTTRLYDRLKDRGYKQDKISNNVEAEIFQLIYDEAIESFDNNSNVKSLQNNDISDLDRNATLIYEELLELDEIIHSD